MKKELAAYTAPEGSFPPYVNFSYDEETDEAVITLREPPFIGGEGNHLINGNTASMRMPIGEFWCLWREAMRGMSRVVPAIQMSLRTERTDR
jgi:hypothetical protein